MDDYYLRRAGLDYWQHLVWEVVDDWQQLRERLGPREPWLMTKHATQSYATVRYEPGEVLVFGCESQGLPAQLRQEHPSRLLRIPTRSETRSLNLSNAVAVTAYEAVRQLDGWNAWDS